MILKGLCRLRKKIMRGMVWEVLRTEHLTKKYGKGDNQVIAVNDVSFSVEQGEFVAIVGSSGSGKSTLLHLLGGVDRPTSGKVFVQGEDIYQMDNDKLAIFRRRQVGLIYQFYNLLPTLNVEENITLPCELDGKSVDRDRLPGNVGGSGTDASGEASSQSTFRRTTAAGIHWPGVDQSSGDCAGRRTDGKFGQQIQR